MWETNLSNSDAQPNTKSNTKSDTYAHAEANTYAKTHTHTYLHTRINIPNCYTGSWQSYAGGDAQEGSHGDSDTIAHGGK